MEVKIWEIVFPLPADAPEISVWVAVQLNVAPTGELDKTILVVAPEQIVLGVGVAVTTGIGLIVTVLILFNGCVQIVFPLESKVFTSINVKVVFTEIAWFKENCPEELRIADWLAPELIEYWMVEFGVPVKFTITLSLGQTEELTTLIAAVGTGFTINLKLVVE